MIAKDYIGDGVYVETSDKHPDVTLTTENGIEVTNVIVMEPAVVAAFINFLKRVGYKIE